MLLEPWINPWATDFFNLVYFSYVLSLPVVALYFYLKKEKTIFRRIMMGYLTLMLMGIASYLIMPAVGPQDFLAAQYTRDLNGHGAIHGIDYMMRSWHVRYNCFPSLRVGISLLVAFYLRDYRRKLFLPALGYVALMCLATLYLRYHYLADLLASFVFVPAAYWLNDFLLAHWPGRKNFPHPSRPDSGHCAERLINEDKRKRLQPMLNNSGRAWQCGLQLLQIPCVNGTHDGISLALPLLLRSRSMKRNESEKSPERTVDKGARPMFGAGSGPMIRVTVH